MPASSTRRGNVSSLESDRCRFILALDQGTTSSRAIVFDHARRTLGAVAQQEFPQIFPQPGWVEHDAEEIWAHAVARRRARRSTRPASAASDVAGDRHHQSARDDVVWDRADRRAVGNAIVWQDRRTAERCERLRARRPRARHPPQDRPRPRRLLLRHEARMDPRQRARRATHAPSRPSSPSARSTPGSSGSSPAAAARHRRRATPRARCSSTSSTGDWDDELLRALRRAARDAARGPLVERGLRRDRRGLLGARDPDRAASPATSRPRSSARSARSPGMAKNTYGTGCFMLMNTGTKPVASSRNRLLTTVAWRIGEARPSTRSKAASSSPAPSCSGCATASGIIRIAPARSKRSRRQVPDTGGVYLVPAFAGLGAPHWDPYARGAHRRPHARHDRGAHRPRGARRHRLPGRRRPRRDGGRLGRAASRAARRRRRRGERPADAVPGRPARRAGRPAREPRDDGPRRRATSPASPSASGKTSTTIASQLAGRAHLRAGGCRGAESRRRRALWSRAVERAKGWADETR